MIPVPAQDGPLLWTCLCCGHTREAEPDDQLTDDDLDDIAAALRPKLEWAADQHRTAGWNIPKG